MEFGSVAPMMKLGVPIIYRVVAVSAACSALGSLFIIITWFLFRELRFLGRKLIVFISVADLITSATFVLSVNGTGAMGGYSLSCVIQVRNPAHAHILRPGSPRDAPSAPPQRQDTRAPTLAASPRAHAAPPAPAGLPA